MGVISFKARLGYQSTTRMIAGTHKLNGAATIIPKYAHDDGPLTYTNAGVW